MEDIIYKYLPVERITYLHDELLRVTQPSDLNDPYECMPILPTMDETLEILKESVIDQTNKFNGSIKQKEKYRNSLVIKYQKIIDGMRQDLPNNHKIRYVEQNMEKVNNTFGLMSFSRRWNSSLMWAHYTNSHKGFCVGFNSKAPFFQNYIRSNNQSRVFEKVYYSDNRIKVPVKNGDITDQKIMFTKSTDWEYENEMRLLVPFEEADKIIDQKPFNICLLKIPHELIREIIIGTNMNSEDKQTIINFCNEKSITLYQSKISELKFDMEKKQI